MAICKKCGREYRFGDDENCIECLMGGKSGVLLHKIAEQREAYHAGTTPSEEATLELYDGLMELIEMVKEMRGE